MSILQSQFLFCSFLFFSGCINGRQIALTDARLPAVKGQAIIKSVENQNTEIKLKFNHLAKPENVVAGTSLYVVWLQGEAPNSRPQNLGALLVDEKLKAELTTLTALKTFKLFLTTEKSGSVQTPSGPELLATRMTL